MYLCNFVCNFSLLFFYKSLLNVRKDVFVQSLLPACIIHIDHTLSMHTNKENNSLNGIAISGLSRPIIKAVINDSFENNTTKDYCRETLYWANSAFYILTLNHPIYTITKENKDHMWANTHVPCYSCCDYKITSSFISKALLPHMQNN